MKTVSEGRLIRWMATLALVGTVSLAGPAPVLHAGDAPPLPGAGGDEEALDVVYRTGHVAQPPVKVVSEDWVVVKGEKGNFKPEYLSTTVELIDYHDRTLRWNQAMDRIQQKNWPKALINFKKMYEPTDKNYETEKVIQERKWSEEIGRYFYGMVLLKNGEAKLAAPEFMKSFAAKQDGRYSLLALLGASDAYLQADQIDDATKTLKQFDDQLAAYGKAFDSYQFPMTMVGAKLECRRYADQLKLQASYIAAKVMYQQAMTAIATGARVPPDAESTCEEFVRKAAELADRLDKQLGAPETQRNQVLYNDLLQQWRDLDAQMTQVSNMLVDIRIGNKDFDGARAKCQQAITDYEKSRDPRMVSRLPAAYAGLGKVAFFEADNLRTRNDPIKAQKMFAKSRWYYQHVLVMYFDNTRYLQDALFYTGLCNEQLAKQSVEKDARERAYDNFKRLAEMLPETDPRYKDVVAALERTKPSGTPEAAPAAN